MGEFENKVVMFIPCPAHKFETNFEISLIYVQNRVFIGVYKYRN